MAALQLSNCSPPIYPYISTSKEGTTSEQWTKWSCLMCPLFRGSTVLYIYIPSLCYVSGSKKQGSFSHTLYILMFLCLIGVHKSNPLLLSPWCTLIMWVDMFMHYDALYIPFSTKKFPNSFRVYIYSTGECSSGIAVSTHLLVFH